MARLSRAFGRPRRCGRDDWQWQIPEGEINVKFDPSTIPDQGKMVWYLGILAQWRELRLSRGGEWTPNVALQLPSAQSTGLCAW